MSQIRYEMNALNYNDIPGNPIVYWVSKSIINDFKNGTALGELAPTKKGLDTGDNDYFLKYWFEVSRNKIGTECYDAASFMEAKKKWALHDKGGEFRKWFGNQEWIINWENNAQELRHAKANLRSERYYFNLAITWSALSSGKISFRLSDYGAISNTAGSSIYPTKENVDYLIAFMNSCVSQMILDMISPTLNYSAGPVSEVPIIFDDSVIDKIKSFVAANVSIAKDDWNNYEYSLNFKKHPLI